MFTFLKELLFFIILSFLFWLFGPDDTANPASFQIPAKPSASSGIYVQDYAGVISAPVRSYLLDLGRQLDQRTTAQLVVVTVKSLKGAPLEEYSLQVLRQWGIGNREKNNGVLMLVSTGDRKSRIEVGYGLEGRLTDSFTGQIQDQYMIPYFRKGAYEEGIAKGYEALARSIAKEYNVQLAASGYANHSPGGVRSGAEGQTTEELFEKALAEQNGTAVQDDKPKSTVSGDAGEGNEPNGSRTDAGKSAANTQNDAAQGVVPNTASGNHPESSTRENVSAGATQTDSASSVAEKEPEGLVDAVLSIAGALVDSWTVILLAFVIFDGFFLGGFFATLFFEILLAALFSGGGGSGGGGSSGGGSFGGGSGGGGGSSRSW